MQCNLALAICHRKLKTWHKVAEDKVIALMSHDLISAKNKWGAGIKDLRELFVRVEQDGFSVQSQAVWRLHWDHQIHKVGKCMLGSTAVKNMSCCHVTVQKMMQPSATSHVVLQVV